MSVPPPLPNKRTTRTSWLPILTTLAYPGAGQFLQGRRIAGWLLTGTTTLVALWWIEEMLRGSIEGMNLSDPTGPTDIFGPFRYVLLPTKFIGLCYLVSFVDAVIAHIRLIRKRG